MTTSSKSDRRFPPLRRGDLVLTDDGYYGIMVKDNEVFLGNGCQEILDAEAITRLRQVPINIFHEGVTATSNFLDMLESRTPAQVQEMARQLKDEELYDPKGAERRRFSRDICGNE